LQGVVDGHLIGTANGEEVNCNDGHES
jgi:hypothetical protein